ncbi:MAG TPA: type II toxin-antitoxin system VapC family toxin [Terriglobales bacterium]|nr:type II toxin-antitoxin system VapC family toxin [Terriglobales bacterium]
MSWLLDTNVVSEWTQPSPSPAVTAWICDSDESQFFLSSVSIAELRFGIELLPSGARRTRLDQWLEHELMPQFGTRILALDRAVADAAGRISARSRKAGRPMALADALIAATASVHSLVLATRNSEDFAATGIAVLNPFAGIRG